MGAEAGRAARVSAKMPGHAALRLVSEIRRDLDEIIAKPCAGALPPGTAEVEQTLLGALLVGGPDALARAGDVRPEHFADDRHRLIVQAIRDERDHSGAVDVHTIAQRLGGNRNLDAVGGLAYLGALAQNTPGTANVARYAQIVREHANRRERAAIAHEIIEAEVRGDREGARAAEARLHDSARDDEALAPLDLNHLAAQEPQYPRHIVPGWLPTGEVTLLGGHGGTGKGFAALGLAACVCTGKPWFGVPTEQRHVLYVSAEDAADILIWRLSHIVAHLGIRLADLVGNLDILDVSGIDAELMADAGRADEPTFTPLYYRLRSCIKAGTVLILDGASDLYGASEIARRYVRKFIRALRRLVGPDGAVLLLAHVDKVAARNKEIGNRYSGSTAWHNSVRSRWELAPEAKSDALVLTLAKANHARAGAQIRLQWDEQAHVFVAEQVPANGGVVEEARDRAEQEGILAALRACAGAGIPVPAAAQGPRTALHVLRAQPTFPESLRADNPTVRRRFWAVIEKMRAMGKIMDGKIRASHRHDVHVLRLG